MRIKSVSFRANVGIGQFQHIHVEASADVPENEDAQTVIDALKRFVAHELQVAKKGIKVKSSGRFQDFLEEDDIDAEDMR